MAKATKYKPYKFPKLVLQFNEKPILFGEIFKDYCDRPLSEHYLKFWQVRKIKDLDFSYSSERMGLNKNAQFQYKYIRMKNVSNTITAGESCVLYDRARYRNFDELISCGSYPQDYNFKDIKPQYLIGMSVPPICTAQISYKIYEQWLKKIK
jgi:DNA (cytosine-5)-methyltransferase 1